jgi:hypothetical protein
MLGAPILCHVAKKMQHLYKKNLCSSVLLLQICLRNFAPAWNSRCVAFAAQAHDRTHFNAAWLEPSSVSDTRCLREQSFACEELRNRFPLADQMRDGAVRHHLRRARARIVVRTHRHSISTMARLRCAPCFKYSTRVSSTPALPASDRPGSSRMRCLRSPQAAANAGA